MKQFKIRKRLSFSQRQNTVIDDVHCISQSAGLLKAKAQQDLLCETSETVSVDCRLKQAA